MYFKKYEKNENIYGDFMDSVHVDFPIVPFLIKLQTFWIHFTDINSVNIEKNANKYIIFLKTNTFYIIKIAKSIFVLYNLITCGILK